MFRSHFSKIPLAACALFVSSGVMHAAAAITASPTSIVLACDTFLGAAAPATVTISQTGGSGPLTVTPTSSTGVNGPNSPLVLPGSGAVPNASSAPFLFSAAAGCKGITNTTTATLTFAATGVTSVTVAVTFTVTATASALAPSPNPVTISCTKAGAVYTPGSAQAVNVTSAANGGTPFTVDNTTNALPSWLTITPLTGGTASATPVALSVVAAAGCGALPVGNTSFTVHLLNAPAPDKLLPVTIQIGAAATLTPSPTSISLAYTKGSSIYNSATSTVTAGSTTFFSVDTSTLPVWLNVTPGSGSTSQVLTFVPTAGAETLALGTYTANIKLKVSGALDTVIPVKLQVSNPAATLSVAEGITRTINWTLGTTIPTLLITPTSSDSPISYTVTTAGTLNPQVNVTKGLAYSFGSPISVTFLSSVFGAAVPGTDIVGTVVITPSGASAITVTITVRVRAPNATISLLSPAALPTATTGSFTVAVGGTGFVVSSDPLFATRIGVVSNGLIVPDGNITATVVNPTNILLTITVPSSTDPYLPFSGTGGSVTVGVCNPQGSTCSTPTGTYVLAIGVNPIIRAVTSASSFSQASAPALTPVAPYDLLSIFGTNFCISGGTGCSGGTPVLYGVTDPVALKYLSTLSPDVAGSTARNVTVTFQQHSSPFTAIANAPLLFATNTQINLVVPDAVKAYIGRTVDIVVSFGYGTGTTMLKSAPYNVTIAVTNPGVFAIGGSGQGNAAALLSPSNTLVGSTNPAGAGAVATTDSDVVQLYVTGLGVPDSLDATAYWGTQCMAVASYFAAVNSNTGVTPALTSDDGLVLQSALFPSATTAPCIKDTSANVPTATIGGISATVLYAGWVPDSIAGLYQINVRVPSNTSVFLNADGTAATTGAAAVALPVIVQAPTNIFSQTSGVNLYIIRRLNMVGTGTLSTGTATYASSGAIGASAVAASGGTAVGSGYTYAVTAGSLPTGLSLNGSTGAISGTPTTPATATQITITSTDTVLGWHGSIVLTITIT